MKHKIRPLGAQLVAQKAAPDQKTKSGLYLPKSAEQKSDTVKVVAVGPNVKAVKVNDQIIFKQYESTNIKIDNQDYLIIDEKSVLAILEGEK